MRLSRLKFLAGGVLGVAFGVATAHWVGSAISWRMYLLAQVTVTSLQLMTHYSNDYFDRSTDAISMRTPFSGGSGVLVTGELTPRIALVSAIVCAVIGIIASIGFYVRENGIAAELGILLAILAWSYSSPPLRLLASGFGEVDTALVVGMLVPMLGYTAQTSTWDWRVLLWSLPAGCAMFAMMICVQIPDYVADGATGKRNLLVRFGLARAPALIVGAGLACMLTALVALNNGAPLRFLWLLPIGVCIAAIGVFIGRLNPPPAQSAFAGVALFVLTQIVSLAALA
ncbi:MAG: prenyltransferase [Candidatus Baltobacteraceae bacterium]